MAKVLLIAKGKEKPVDIKWRKVKVTLLVLVSIIWILVSIGRLASARLANCDSNDAKVLVTQILNKLFTTNALSIQVISIKAIEEKEFNQETQVRACSGILTTKKGENNFEYTIKWGNKGKDKILIEALIK